MDFLEFLNRTIFLDRMDEKDKNGYINSGHASQALQKMDQFLRNRQLCDVVLIAGNRRIPAHRLVLCSLRYDARSLYDFDTVQSVIFRPFRRPV